MAMNETERAQFYALPASGKRLEGGALQAVGCGDVGGREVVGDARQAHAQRREAVRRLAASGNVQDLEPGFHQAVVGEGWRAAPAQARVGCGRAHRE